MRRVRFEVSVCVVAGIAACAYGVPAAAETPDIKLGLWETVRITSHSGNPAVDLSRIPPEQRARAAALARKAENEPPKKRVSRACLTQAKLERDFFSEKGMVSAACKREVVTDTKTEHDVKIECAGKHSGTGEMTWKVNSPEEVAGKFTLSTPDPTGASEPYTVTSEFTSKWVAEKCGRVK